jgi:hypothetical protein
VLVVVSSLVAFSVQLPPHSLKRSPGVVVIVVRGFLVEEVIAGFKLAAVVLAARGMPLTVKLAPQAP